MFHRSTERVHVGCIYRCCCPSQSDFLLRSKKRQKIFLSVNIYLKRTFCELFSFACVKDCGVNTIKQHCIPTFKIQLDFVAYTKRRLLPTCEFGSRPVFDTIFAASLIIVLNRVRADKCALFRSSMMITSNLCYLCCPSLTSLNLVSPIMRLLMLVSV